MPTEKTVAITCIACPQGCAATLTIRNGQVVAISGTQCKRGEEYVRQEYSHPQRVLTSTVLLKGGGWLPVRSRGMVPKERIFDVMAALQNICCGRPVRVGDVVLRNVLGLGVDIVATASRDSEATLHGSA